MEELTETQFIRLWTICRRLDADIKSSDDIHNREIKECKEAAINMVRKGLVKDGDS